MFFDMTIVNRCLFVISKTVVVVLNFYKSYLESLKWSNPVKIPAATERKKMKPTTATNNNCFEMV